MRARHLLLGHRSAEASVRLVELLLRDGVVREERHHPLVRRLRDAERRLRCQEAAFCLAA
jgi:hypothetical protein